ncbi:glycolate oxidase subunit GlcE [soil metagenome]
MIESWQQAVEDAARTAVPLALRGGGTKHWLGQAEAGTPVETGTWSGVVDYEPSELVITVRAGTPLAEVEHTLAEHGQVLAFEPPRFGAASTIGGVVAAGLSGPRRIGYGAVSGALRESVLGLRLLDGRARHLRFGGTVMKNVAGYDVSRLIAGSMGVLGLITELSLKALPKPPLDQTLCFEASEIEAIERLNRWAGQPLPISASAWRPSRAGDGSFRSDADGSRLGMLTLRLSGSQPAVESAIARLGGEQLPAELAERSWTGLRDQTDEFFDTLLPVWRIGVPQTAAPLELDGDTLIEWHGAQRFVIADLDADELRARLRPLGGHATAWRSRSDGSSAPARQASAFTPLTPALMTIHRRLKAEFDPAGIFNRGRLYPDL